MGVKQDIGNHRDDEYGQSHDHSPKDGHHVDLRLSHKNKDEKSQKRNAQPVSESTDELRANNSKTQIWIRIGISAKDLRCLNEHK